MITEDYVNFETAKLLKENGFDGPCYKVWESHDDSQTLVGAPWFVEGETVVNKESVDAAAKQYADEYNINNKVEGYLAPTLQMAMKWLREIYKLEVRSIYDYDKDSWWGNINPMFEETDENSDIYQKALRFDYQGKSYEEACEAVIKYCLKNLI